MKPWVCSRLSILGAMLVTLAASTTTTNSAGTKAPYTTRHDNHTHPMGHATAITASSRSHSPNETSAAVTHSGNTSARTSAPANITATSHGRTQSITTGPKVSAHSGTTDSTQSKHAIPPKSEPDAHNKNVYIILIIIIVVVLLMVPCIYLCKKKKGYDVDNPEDAGVPLSAMDQDAFEGSSPKEITPALKTFTANESSAEARQLTSDAVHVTVEDGNGELGNSVKQGSISAQAPADQPAEKLDDLMPGDTDISNQTSVESLKDLPNENDNSGTRGDGPKAAEAPSGTPAENFSEVKLDGSV